MKILFTFQDGEEISYIFKSDTVIFSNLPTKDDYMVNPNNSKLYKVNLRVFDPIGNIITIILKNDGGIIN